MALFACFYPSDYVNSAYSIDYEKLYQSGIRGIIYDIDNTLVEHGKPATPRAVELFARLGVIGFQTCVISNNKEPRVAPFAEAVGTMYIYKADKPSVKGYQQAMERMGTNTGNTVFIGDQLFTDVWGANRTGIRSILVKPIDKHEEVQIVLKRYLEKVVLHFYRRNQK